MGSSHSVPENHLEHGVSIQSGTLGTATFKACGVFCLELRHKLERWSLNSHSLMYLQLDLFILSSVNEPANHHWFLSSIGLVLISFLVSAHH